MSYLVGIDLGSTSLKAVIYDLEGNAVAMGSTATERDHPHPDHPEWTEWRPDHIWNGACSSGQESYTLAMSIIDNFPDLTLPGRTQILSTDVSPQMVERTREGKYSRFEVNRGAAERAGLRLSSRLLRLARLVEVAEEP